MQFNGNQVQHSLSEHVFGGGVAVGSPSEVQLESGKTSVRKDEGCGEEGGDTKACNSGADGK